jgi:predicted nucleotidyltransferase
MADCGRLPVSSHDRIDWGRRVPKRLLERLVAAASRVCAEHPDVELAWLHGSVLRGGLCHDIDLGLVVRPDRPRPWEVAQEVCNRLEPFERPAWIPRVPVPWDVRALSKAGPPFLFRVISTGRCVFERSSGERVFFEAQVMSQWIEFRPVWEAGERRVLEGPTRGW